MVQFLPFLENYKGNILTILAAGQEILELIPQRPPMVMIDTLYTVTEMKAESGLTVSADNIFVRDGQLTAMGLVENMAQTAAAMAGYYFKSQNEEVKTGFIGSIKNLKIQELPPLHAQLKTTITQIQEVMNIKIIKGEVFLGDELQAECEMKIFLVDASETD